MRISTLAVLLVRSGVITSGLDGSTWKRTITPSPLNGSDA
jgi:hypothetical protein